jgi:hypothetical protein
MSQEPLGVGADIDVECSQCGLFTHIIVAKVGAEIAKIACKRCGRSRRLRAAEKEQLFGPKVAATARGRRTTTGSSSSPRGSASRPGASKAPAPLPIDPNRPATRYRPQESFRTGDLIEHPSFGRGRVEALVAPGKISVQFNDGVRLLVHARPATSGSDSSAAPA